MEQVGGQADDQEQEDEAGPGRGMLDPVAVGVEEDRRPGGTRDEDGNCELSVGRAHGLVTGSMSVLGTRRPHLRR
jgi:hypothetical protein